MISDLLQLLKFKFKLSYNSATKSIKTIGGAFQTIISTFIFLAFGVGVFLFTKTALHLVLEQLNIGLFLLHRFISMILFVFFLSINAGNMIVAFSMIFKSREVSELMTKPIEHSKLFIFKMFESIFYSSPVFLLVGLGVLAGYGTYFNMPLFFYPLVFLFLFLPFVFISAILGIIELILLLQLARKFEIKKIATGVIIVYLISLIGFFQITNPKNLVNSVMNYYPNINFDFHFLDPKLLIFLPNHWFSEAILLFIRNDFNLSFQYILMINLVFLTIFIAAIAVGTKFYYSSFSCALQLKNIFSRHDKREKMFRNNSIFNFTYDSPFEKQTEVILKKEFYQFFRDPAQWIHLSVIIFLIILFITSIAKVDLMATLPLMQSATYLIIFIFNAFLISSITLRFLYPIISIEAEAFWKIKSSPLKIEKIIKLKFFPSFLATLILSEVLNFFSHLPIREHTILFITSSINIIFASTTLSAINFGMGSYFITFNEKNPVKIASSQGATIAFLINLIYLILLVIVLFIPINEYFSQSIVSDNLKIKFIFSSLILLITSVISLIISFVVSKKKLSSDF